MVEKIKEEVLIRFNPPKNKVKFIEWMEKQKLIKKLKTQRKMKTEEIKKLPKG